MNKPLSDTQLACLSDCVAKLIALSRAKKAAESQTVQAQDSAASPPPGEAEQRLDSSLANALAQKQ